MRSQILPLALCLLLTLIGSGVTVSAMELDVKTNTKVVENKEISSKQTNVSLVVTTNSNQDMARVNSNPAIQDKYLPASLLKQKQYPVVSENFYGSNFSEASNSIVKPIQNVEKVVSNKASFQKGMYYGFACMVILLNFVCFLLFEDKLYLFYSMALIGFTSVFFFNDGLFIPSFIAENELLLKVLQSGLLLIAISFSTIFASKYLMLSEHVPKLKKVTIVSIGIAAISLILAGTLNNSIFVNVANTILFTVMGVYFAAGVFLFGKKNYPKFYVIAYSIPLLFAFDYFVLQNMGISFLATETFHLKAASIAEMLIVTFAILYRMRAIKEEAQLRQTEMRIYLKRQEVMGKNTAADMINDVYLENLIMQYDLDGLEIKLLQYISEGKPNEKIARKLKTTENDIENLINELYNKLAISEHIKEDYRMVDSQPDYIYN